MITGTTDTTQPTRNREIPPEIWDRIVSGAWNDARASLSLAPVWTPQPGPQANAFLSSADVIGYGGAAGGGKSDLLLGKAGTQHRRSIVFRRVFPSLRGLIERSREIFNAANDPHSRDSYNEQLHLWRIRRGTERLIEFASVQYDQDLKKYQGQPHDFIGIDEATEFPESFVRFLMGWNRSTVPGQKCQTILTFNPPMDDLGSWVTAFFGPWIDPQNANPAQDGEWRYFARVDGKEIERPDGTPFDHKGETIVPRSRTFFHATLKDNPILAATGYGAQIDALPEPLRSYLKGNFAAARTVNPFQTIPYAWVRAAMDRWTADRFTDPPIDHGKMTAIGADVSRGGDDQTVISRVYGDWFAPLLEYPGISVPDGPTAAGLILAAAIDDTKDDARDAQDQDHKSANVPIGVDIVGIGASCYDSLIAANVAVEGINFGEGSDETDKSGRLRMRNVRAAAYWRFREALDPANGSTIKLPDDPRLLADLCASSWRLDRGSGRVQIEDKDEIKSRLGRSPDCGDAVVLAWWAARFAGPWHW